MDFDAAGGTFDPELDLLPRRPGRRTREPLDGYQLLVVNPLLVVLSWLVAVAVIRFAVRDLNLTVFVVGIVQMLLSMLLVQFHCLDCGATGWLLEHRRHSCPAVIARWQAQHVRRIHGPTVGAQILLWFLFIMTGFVLAMILYFGP
jgi:hypothetical protein